MLIVEDDEICVHLNEKFLNSIDIPKQIYVARNGREALEVFNLCFNGDVSLPDSILLDLNMPVVDGFQFIKAFQKLQFTHKEKVLLVITTSSMDSVDLERAGNLGVKYYLEKPISKDVLKSIINVELGLPTTTCGIICFML